MVLLLLTFRLAGSDRIKKLALLTSSFLVYYLLSGKMLLALVFITFFNFFLGRKICFGTNSRKLLILGLSVNLITLSYFKYTNFFLQSLSGLINGPLSSLNIILPVGISFYIFNSISYLVDIYRGKYLPTDSLADYALHIAFFPKIIAGPIVRPGELIPQFTGLGFAFENLKPGLILFLLGMFKKFVLADRLALYLDPVFAQPGLFSSYTLWLTALGYSVQIYCDFSGYTDMAVGTTRVLGIRLPGNFEAPYGSLSVSEFWRRWHITLSSWLRDYLYIPLGGSRVNPIRTNLNLIITMLLGGFWHGANWTFMVWGLMHGLALAAERTLSGIIRFPAIVRWVVTYIFITLCWVIFHASDLTAAGNFLKKMVTFDPQGITWTFGTVLPVILTVPIVHLLSKNRSTFTGYLNKLPGYICWNFLIFITMAIIFLKPGSSSPFTYLQF